MDLDRLSQLAELAAYGSPDGYGVAWTENGRHFGQLRGLTSLAANLKVLRAAAKDAVGLIGQCQRYDQESGPLVGVGPGFIAYNGAAAAEPLGLRIAQRRKNHDLRDAIYWALAQDAGEAPYALLTLWPTKRASVAMIRRREPLYSDGAYICSLPFPGGELIAEHKVHEVFLSQTLEALR